MGKDETVNAPSIDLSKTGVEVAPLLLGAVFSSGTGEERVSIRITEVEAYMGPADPGSHAFRGKSARTASMFGPPEHIYVYQHLGLHHCMNIVCSPEGTASAVLLRSGEVVEGEGIALARRLEHGACKNRFDIARGPGRLTVALAITRADDGAALGLSAPAPGRGLQLQSTGTVAAADITTSPRVGVSGDGGTKEYPWRFWIKDDPFVTQYRKATKRRHRS